MSSCIICDHNAIKEYVDFANLLRVTSDSRIWGSGGKIAICPECHTVQKPIDDSFMKDADEIYSTYQLYFQAGGKEQKIFTDDGPLPRSEILLNHLLSSWQAPANCAALDVGCGVGNLLQAINKRNPDWKLFGADINNNTRDQILSITGVEDFFGGDIRQIDRKFDVIFISHVLEHVPTPSEFLKQLAKLLTDDGVLVILVPYWKDNAFDLLVADHCIHFSHGSIEHLLNKNGFKIISKSSTTLPKELFVMTTSGAGSQKIGPKKDNRKAMEQSLLWLKNTVSWASEVNKEHKKIGVLGTALAATWITHAAKLTPEFFVDEDPDRQNILYLDCPVISPKNIPDSSFILVPLPFEISENVSKRLNEIYGNGKEIFLCPPK